MNPTLRFPLQPARPARLSALILLGSLLAALGLGLWYARPSQAQAAMDIAITPEQSVISGQMTSITITVTNTGSETLFNISASASPSNVLTSCGRASSLASGASQDLTCSVSPLYMNVELLVTVAGYDSLANQVTASATTRLKAEHLKIWKTPELQTVSSGQAAAFTMIISSTGDFTLTNIAVADPLSPACARPAGTLADLGPGQQHSYTCQTDPLFSKLENQATATADLSGQGFQVTAKSEAVVEVISPLAVSQTPDRQTVPLTDPAAFSITLQNTGGATLENLAVADPAAPDCARTAGALPNLAPGGSYSYGCQSDPLAAALVNDINASGTAGGVQALASTRAEVDITFVKISVDPAYQFAYPGQTATFTVTVINVHDSQNLSGISVAAPEVPDCSRASLADLAPAVSHTYTCQTLPEQLVVNELTVSAAGPVRATDADPLVFSDTAIASVGTYLPLIHGPFFPNGW